MKLSNTGPLVALAALFGLASISFGAPQPPKNVAAAVAAVEKAATVEDAANREWTSREMARSATREIARSERTRSEKALEDLLAARTEVERLEATSKSGGQKNPKLAAARAQLEQKTLTMRTVEERLINDTRAANKAALELTKSEDRTRGKMAAARAAERALLQMKGPAAKKAWEDWKVKAAKLLVQREKENVRYKTTAPSENPHESKILDALEFQLWAEETKRTCGQIIEQSGDASRVAARVATAETDPKLKEALEGFAAEQAGVVKDAKKLIARKDKAIANSLVRVYTPRTVLMGGLKPLAPDAWDLAKARHLLVRAGFGGTPQEVKELHAMGLHAAVDTLVDFHRQPSTEVALDIALPQKKDPIEEKLRNDFLVKRAAAARTAAETTQAARLKQWWLQRIVESPRPLQEKLTLFWHGHFANQQSVVKNSYTMYRQNQLFREHAAGNFRGLLYGIVHDPAMIRYLDNNKNVKGHPNENLAREIMELFAMGEDQGYTEADIREAGRALTGYNFDHDTGQFRLVHSEHDEGEKTVFGKKGNWTGDDLVHLLLEQPATSRFIAKRLFEFFAHGEPGEKTIEQLATVLRAGDYELAPMLKNLFQSQAFYSEQSMGTKIKSPVQLVAGMMRDLGVDQVADYGALNAAVEAMGQKLLEPPDVKGWRRGRSWISANRIFTRYNSSAELLKTIVRPGNQRGVDVVALFKSEDCKDAAEVVDYLVTACFVQPLNDEQRRKLCASLRQLPPQCEWAKRPNEINRELQGLLVLMVSTPEYQMN